jgi:hypothetical protein
MWGSLTPGLSKPNPGLEFANAFSVTKAGHFPRPVQEMLLHDGAIRFSGIKLKYYFPLRL